MNQIYGFEGEVKAKYTAQMFALFSEVFEWLPLAQCINGKVLVRGHRGDIVTWGDICHLGSLSGSVHLRVWITIWQRVWITIGSLSGSCRLEQ